MALVTAPRRWDSGGPRGLCDLRASTPLAPEFFVVGLLPHSPASQILAVTSLCCLRWKRAWEGKVLTLGVLVPSLKPKLLKLIRWGAGAQRERAVFSSVLGGGCLKGEE